MLPHSSVHNSITFNAIMAQISSVPILTFSWPDLILGISPVSAAPVLSIFLKINQFLQTGFRVEASVDDTSIRVLSPISLLHIYDIPSRTISIHRTGFTLFNSYSKCIFSSKAFNTHLILETLTLNALSEVNIECQT